MDRIERKERVIEIIESGVRIIAIDGRCASGKSTLSEDVKKEVDDIGFLICATSTIEDYYYMYMDKDRNIKMSSCVGGYEIIESPETIQNLSVLSYIRKHDKMYIKEKITRYIKNLKYDKVITNIFY